MNKSKSNRRFQGASSIDKNNYKNNRRMYNGSQNAYQFSKQKHFMQSNHKSQNFNEGKMNQYQTVSYPKDMNSNNVITFQRENDDQYGTRKPKISANLTQSYAQFQEFELNAHPVKNINALINPTRQRHTAQNVITKEKKNTLKGIIHDKNKKMYGKQRKPSHLDQLKQRSQNMSDKFMNPNGLQRKQTQYEQKKKEFLKNIKGNRKTMSNAHANKFLPSNNLANLNSRGYARTQTNRSTSKYAQNSKNMYKNNYSNRNNSKQLQQMHKKMNKHKSVSNLHYMGQKANFKPGSSRHLNGSGVQGLGMNKSTTWKNKF